MVRVRILKRQNSAYMELPEGLLGYDEVELFELKKGYYLLTAPLGQAAAAAPAPKGGEITERSVLKKLLAIRFENRTPANVSKALSEEEKAVLAELERKGLVNVFKGTKYKEGVYNVRDSAYALARKETGNPEPKTGNREPGTVGREPGTTQPASGMDTAAILVRQGYLVVGDRNEARALSERLGQQMKSGAVAGVKGFDNRFYIVTRAYLTKAQASIESVLKEDMDAAGIAAAARLEPEGCLAVLRLLAESGNIIEKKRGIFAPV